MARMLFACGKGACFLARDGVGQFCPLFCVPKSIKILYNR